MLSERSRSSTTKLLTLNPQLSTRNFRHLGLGDAQEVGWGDLDLEATHTGTDVDVGVLVAGVVHVGGEVLLHADGRAAATDVAGEGQELLHGDHLALLVARYLGGELEVDGGIAGDDAHEVAGAVALQDEGLEHLGDVFAQRLGYMGCGEVALIYLVGDELVGYLGLVEQAGCIGLLDFCHDLFLMTKTITKTPTRYESVGCDDENFSSSKESLSTSRH